MLQINHGQTLTKNWGAFLVLCIGLCAVEKIYIADIPKYRQNWTATLTQPYIFWYKIFKPTMHF